MFPAESVDVPDVFLLHLFLLFRYGVGSRRGSAESDGLCPWSVRHGNGVDVRVTVRTGRVLIDVRVVICDGPVPRLEVFARWK